MSPNDKLTKTRNYSDSGKERLAEAWKDRPNHISDEKHVAVLAHRANGLTYRQIAEATGVSIMAISGIINGKRKVSDPKTTVTPKVSSARFNKIPEETREAVRQQRAAGASYKTIAETFGISQASISFIITGHRPSQAKTG